MSAVLVKVKQKAVHPWLGSLHSCSYFFGLRLSLLLIVVVAVLLLAVLVLVVFLVEVVFLGVSTSSRARRTERNFVCGLLSCGVV